MINPLSSKAEIIYYDKIDSTMLEARRLIDKNPKGICSGTVIRAGYQSKGRGRIAERRWEVPYRDGLLFTVIFSLDDLEKRMEGKSFLLFPLLCGLAVSKAIESLKVKSKVEVKWPNDVLVDGKKICGIICEKSVDNLFAGIGINLNQREFPASIRKPACSVRTITGKYINSEELLFTVLKNIKLVLSNNAWEKELEKKLFLINKMIKIRVGLAKESSEKNKVINGRLLGINPSGAVVIETTEGQTTVINGEICSNFQEG